MKKQEFTREQLLQALCVKKNLPLKLNDIERQRAETLLTKRLTLAEAFEVVEILTYPYNKEMKDISGRLSVLNYVVDKLAKKLKVTDKALDKIYDEAKEEFTKANQKAIEDAKKAIKGASNINEKGVK